jgi:hypothetical protein
MKNGIGRVGRSGARSWAWPRHRPRPVHRLTDLVDDVRAAVAVHAYRADTLRSSSPGGRKAHLPDQGVLTAEQRRGSPDDYCGHTPYIDPDDSFAIVAPVWRFTRTTTTSPGARSASSRASRTSSTPWMTPS